MVIFEAGLFWFLFGMDFGIAYQLHYNISPMLPQHNRGDWTPLELLIAGVRVWEAELCRFIVWLSDGKRP